MEYQFNRCVDQLKPSASIALMDKARVMRAEGVDVISLAGGEPDCDTPARASYAGIKGVCKGQTHYTAGRGIPALRARIAKKLSEENGVACTPAEILVTPGGKFAIFVAMQTLVNPGDEVLILDPSWVSYASIAVAAGAKPVAVELAFENNYAITEKALEEKVSEKTRVMIVNSPNNPTGRMLTDAEAKAISAFAIRHNIMVISDEIYEKIAYDGRRHLSLASIAALRDQVVTINGFSKCAAMTGWRLGYLQANQQVVDKIYMLYQHTMTCISEFSQEAALVALDCAQEIEEMRQSYAKRRELFVGGLKKLPGVTCLSPEGAFYAWVRIEKDNMTAEQLSDYLLEKALVVTVPGGAYGLGGDKCVRMSFATAEKDLKEALVRMERALR